MGVDGAEEEERREKGEEGTGVQGRGRRDSGNGDWGPSERGEDGTVERESRGRRPGALVDVDMPSTSMDDAAGFCGFKDDASPTIRLVREVRMSSVASWRFHGTTIRHSVRG